MDNMWDVRYLYEIPNAKHGGTNLCSADGQGNFEADGILKSRFWNLELRKERVFFKISFLVLLK
jgi:hypothetical protein